jgi:hypothetical protein
LHEHTAPVALLVQRIPSPMLEGMYGLSIYQKSIEEGSNSKITAEDFLKSYTSTSLEFFNYVSIVDAPGFSQLREGLCEQVKGVRMKHGQHNIY